MSLIFDCDKQKESVDFSELDEGVFFTYSDGFGDTILAFRADDSLITLSDSGVENFTPWVNSEYAIDEDAGFNNVQYISQLDFVVKGVA